VVVLLKEEKIDGSDLQKLMDEIPEEPGGPPKPAPTAKAS
jgi:hypothetical protein